MEISISSLKIGFRGFIAGLCGLVFLSGCAVQNSTREYFKAEKLIQQVKKEQPQSPRIREAEEKLRNGKFLMDSARYDVALKELKESTAIAQSILKKDPIPPTAAAPTGSAPADLAAVTPEAPAADVKSAEELEKEDARAKLYKRSLPKEALARYLAGKKSGAAVPAPKKPSSAAVAPAPKPAPAKIVVSIPKKEEKSAVEPEDDVSKKAKAGASTESKLATPKGAPAEQIAEDADAEPQLDLSKVESVGEKTAQSAEEKEALNVPVDEKVSSSEEAPTQKFPEPVKVTAPAKPEFKNPPAVKAPPPREKPKAAEKKKEEDESAGDVTSKAAVGKRRIPGTLVFFENDASVQPDMMAVLDQTSKYLLDNPSVTLVLQSQLSTKEADSITNARYESVRSYLVGKAVPEDQITLDTERRKAKSPEFKLFVIEH